jgi:hypothetical protein
MLLMKPVYQTKFGGPSAPREEQGNCMQAVLASVFELPLEQAFNAVDYGDDDWYEHLQEWLAGRGLYFQCFIPEAEPPPGYHLIGGKGPTGIQHVVVGKGGAVVHDPVPGGYPIVSPEWTGVFTCLDPARHR